MLKVELKNDFRGLVIHLLAATQLEFEELVGVFSGLSSGEKNEYTLDEHFPAELAGVKAIDMVVVSAKRDPTIAFRFMGKPFEENVRCQWTLTKEGWMDCYLLTREMPRGHHQYLTNQGLDEALVEVYFG